MGSDVRDMLVTIYISEAKCGRGDDLSIQICNAVLRILINGIMALPHGGSSYKNDNDNDNNDDFLDQECEYFVKELVPCLVESARNYHFTHNACLALDCLCLLTKKSSLACCKARDMNADNVIEQAELYGKREHLKLEEAARSTLASLQTEIFAI